MLNVPPTDSRCSDPAFAEKYPSACRFFSRLILKNERSKALVGVLVPFKAFVMANGIEVELSATLEVDPGCVPEVLFEDNFNTENGAVEGTNYKTYANWDLPPPLFDLDLSSTDLLSSLTIPSITGQGMFVDLKGTGSFDASWMRQKVAIGYVSGETYKLSFKLAGNLRASQVAPVVNLTLGSLISTTLNPAWDEPLTLREYTFTPTSDESAKIFFKVSNAGDLGPLLDDVVIERLCPESEPVEGASSGVVFSSSNTAIATVDSVTGIVNTISPGKVTISAKWNNQYAYAELEVVADCNVAGNYLVLIDNSFSMQQNFDGVYPTKLAYAKYLAERFFSSMNTTKDQMALGSFNVESDINVEYSNVISTLKGAVPNLFTTPVQTDLQDAIEHGVEYLNEIVTSGLKVLVLITDGQYNKGGLPGPIAREFKQSGGIIIVVGVRVFDVYFQLLNEISTKGYFLSAYGAVATAVGTNLIGLKSFLCSGDCPSGAVYGCLTEPLDTQIADPDPLQVQSEY